MNSVSLNSLLEINPNMNLAVGGKIDVANSGEDFSIEQSLDTSGETEGIPDFADLVNKIIEDALQPSSGKNIKNISDDNVEDIDESMNADKTAAVQLLGMFPTEALIFDNTENAVPQEAVQELQETGIPLPQIDFNTHLNTQTTVGTWNVEYNEITDVKKDNVLDKAINLDENIVNRTVESIDYESDAVAPDNNADILKAESSQSLPSSKNPLASNTVYSGIFNADSSNIGDVPKAPAKEIKDKPQSKMQDENQKVSLGQQQTKPFSITIETKNTDIQQLTQKNSGKDSNGNGEKDFAESEKISQSAVLNNRKTGYETFKIETSEKQIQIGQKEIDGKFHTVKEQITDSVHAMLSSDKKELKIDFSPPNLGSIKIELVTNDKKEIIISIITRDSGVKSAIESNLSSLINNISDSGVSVKEFTVSVGGNRDSYLQDDGNSRNPARDGFLKSDASLLESGAETQKINRVNYLNSVVDLYV
ncbi:MAG: flagellar hook-length control protein FliK [Candidatus Schekmanbacteria bacterium]|nr:flagellar hook-length control protein FliK [Candidatus Schekmanbacteria bacterium]